MILTAPFTHCRRTHAFRRELHGCSRAAYTSFRLQDAFSRAEEWLLQWLGVAPRSWNVFCRAQDGVGDSGNTANRLKDAFRAAKNAPFS